ncbi:MAG: ATP-binding protein [Pseudomonadota bacterium]
MLSQDTLLAVALGYVVILFAVAFLGDRRASLARGRWLQSPLVYTLSISVYCTSWTFYGAVGSAARSGLEFATIYLGPTLVFVGWWWTLRKLVRIGRVHRITSIADLISSRYGKSSTLAVIVTLIALTATTPYIALQLQSITASFEAISGATHQTRTAFWVACGLAAFTILFGTRTINANERHHGVVAAIALEAVVKLAALLAVGIFAVWGVADGIGDIFERMPEEMVDPDTVFGPRWFTMTLLAGAAVLCLPRQFQVTVVENTDERHLVTASWMFPLYMFLMSLFVLPLAIAGQAFLPAGSNPDLYVIELPLAFDQQELALLVFIGGFSSATSMVIVAAIALSTMVSNHIVAPLALRSLMQTHAASGDVREVLIASRRITIGAILGLGFLYLTISEGTAALAAMGLIAFVGAAQVLPAMLGGIVWRGATRAGAIAGLSTGAALWLYTLFLPALAPEAAWVAEGPLGIAALKPEGLLGLAGADPIVHATIWSLGVNTLLFIAVSVFAPMRPLELLQGALFVEVFRGGGDGGPGDTPRFTHREAAVEDLFVLAQRILGADTARRLFDIIAREQGVEGGLPVADDTMIARLERELAGSIGAASAHAMLMRATGGEITSLSELLDIADETQRLMETTQRLAEKTAELEQTASALRRANERLRQLDRQKDEFLSQVSHELRTPMTSIRSFSEILLSEPDIREEERTRFVDIIHSESIRLTRLLDEILDISRLESGVADIPLEPLEAAAAIRGALDSVTGLARSAGVTIEADLPGPEIRIAASPDRLRQVLINLLSNAVKYNTAPDPRISVSTTPLDGALAIDVADNGGGVTTDEAEEIFSKFARGRRASAGQGAGLGLPISRAIAQRMGGDLTVVFRDDGSSFFRTTMRLAEAGASPLVAGRSAAE